jgi:ABC-2 type transport system permease protein
MSGLGILTRKELKEQWRTYKLVVVAVIFLFLGLATPLMVKSLPDLIKLAGEEIKIELPPPTAAQAFKEYADTLTQAGVLATILIAMGAIAQERERGTAAMVLSKPVSRSAFVLAKLLAMSVTFGVSLAAAAAGCYLYAVLLFDEAAFFPFAGLNLLMGLFFILCLAVTLLCSSFFKSQLAAGGVALALLIGQALLSGIPGIGRYAPGEIINWGTRMISGDSASAWGAVVTSLGVIILCVLLACSMLRRREL